MTSLKSIQASEARRRLDSGEAVLIDIRESDENAREHILGARLAPLSAIDAHDFDRDHAKIAVFHCKSGMRTQANAAKLLARGFREAYCLDGGIEAWKKAGFPVHTNKTAPLELMRQVQIAAGLLVLTGLLAGWLVHPAFFALSAFVGAGLTFAGATGWCGMALLLKQMPWNRGSFAG
ncbi:MAG: rhodanese family protein [Hyphomonadaceae bacterium]